MLLIGVSSCKDDPISFQYEFNITGHATGNVDVVFPGGSFVMDGNTELAFSYASAVIPFAEYQFTSVPVSELRTTEGKEWSELADAVLKDYSNAFAANSASGTYYLHIIGSIREQVTGLEFEIDRVLTNEPADDKSE